MCACEYRYLGRIDSPGTGVRGSGKLPAIGTGMWSLVFWKSSKPKFLHFILNYLLIFNLSPGPGKLEVFTSLKKTASDKDYLYSLVVLFESDHGLFLLPFPRTHLEERQWLNFFVAIWDLTVALLLIEMTSSICFLNRGFEHHFFMLWILSYVLGSNYSFCVTPALLSWYS